ncbi:MAG: DNA repair protein RecO [Bdellovibrionales bacterium]
MVGPTLLNPSYSYKAIVMRSVEFGESDLIVTFLLSNGEKKTFKARGAKNSKKRFSGGVLEIGNYIMFRTSKSKYSENYELAEASLLKDFTGIRQSYDRIEAMYNSLQVAEFTTQDGLEATELFHLVGNFLTELNKVKDPTALFIKFLTRLLWVHGVLPEQSLLTKYGRQSLQQQQEISKKEQKEIKYELRNAYENAFGLNKTLKDFFSTY